MDEQEMIKALRQHRPRPPSAPLGEWESIALRARPANAWRWAWAWGGGLALAGLAFVFLPLTPASTELTESASLEPYLSELGQELSGASVASSQEDYLALASLAAD